MKDRFKFRAWIKSEKRYGYLLNLFNCGANSKKYEVEEYDEQGDYYTVYSSDEVVLQQCTGLKDKNGNLIYEGDILRVNTGSRDTSCYGVVEYLQCGCKFIVTGYLDNPSGYYPRKQVELCRNLEEWLCTEVIGNIYENQGLLDVKND